MSKINISIIVPVYNAEKYLGRCVDSILKQAYKEFELILVDDGSTDSCGKLCDMYMERDSRIRVIHQANQGQATARNRAVSVAKGNYISFVDADDVIHPRMLEILYKTLRDNNVQISACGAYEGKEVPDKFYSESQYAAYTIDINEEEILKLYKGKYLYWVPWGKLIEKRILLAHPFPEGRKYEDNAIVYKWLYTAKSIAVCDEELYFYFINESGTTKSRYSLSIMDWLRALKEQTFFYKEEGLERMVREIAPRYVKETLFQREKISKILHEQRAADDLKKDVCCFLLRYHRFLSRNEKKEVLARLFPGVYSLKQKLGRFAK